MNNKIFFWKSRTPLYDDQPGSEVKAGIIFAESTEAVNIILSEKLGKYSRFNVIEINQDNQFHVTLDYVE
jgi:hypothetical protein